MEEEHDQRKEEEQEINVDANEPQRKEEEQEINVDANDPQKKEEDELVNDEITNAANNLIQNPSTSTLRDIQRVMEKWEESGLKTSHELYEQLTQLQTERKKTKRAELKSTISEAKETGQFSLKQLHKIMENCRFELPPNDSLLRTLSQIISRREDSFRVPLEKLVSPDGKDASNQTLQSLKKILEKCKKELPDDDPLIRKVETSIQNRIVSHRQPLENTLNQGDLNLKTLALLERKCAMELPKDDPIFPTIKKLTKTRDASHRVMLADEFSQLLQRIDKNAKKVKPAEVRAFVERCADELPSDDALFAQIQSAQERHLLESSGKKQVKVIDGNRPSDADTDNGKGDKSLKKSSSSSKEDKKKLGRKSSSSKVSPISSSQLGVPLVVKEFVVGVKDDLYVQNEPSVYKFCFWITVLLYIAIAASVVNLTMEISPIDFKFFSSTSSDVNGADGSDSLSSTSDSDSSSKSTSSSSSGNQQNNNNNNNNNNGGGLRANSGGLGSGQSSIGISLNNNDNINNNNNNGNSGTSSSSRRSKDDDEDNENNSNRGGRGSSGGNNNDSGGNDDDDEEGGGGDMEGSID